jgi:hypothetical protein
MKVTPAVNNPKVEHVGTDRGDDNAASGAGVDEVSAQRLEILRPKQTPFFDQLIIVDDKVLAESADRQKHRQGNCRRANGWISHGNSDAL